LLPALAVLVAAGAGCRQAMPHAQPSVDALVREVLSALERRDINRLRQLALSESEFREVVWPELPAARPERNLSVDYVWNDLRMKSEASLARTLAEHGGKAHVPARVEFKGETTQHQTYLVYRESVVIVRHDGREEPLNLFGSLIERDSGFKVYSYVVD
jgi:hypothetical protein